MRDTKQANPATPIEIQREFRDCMGLFATGVCVIAIPSGEQGLSAMTVNSFVSVSLDPMLVCWSLQNDASQFDLYLGSEYFTVSILAERHAELALRYAARADTQLQSADFAENANGLPVIADALAHIECRRWSDYAAGDHTMIFGEVTGMRSETGNPPSQSPLGFFNGKFCSIAP